MSSDLPSEHPAESSLDSALASPDRWWPKVRRHARTQAEVAHIIFGNVPTSALATYAGLIIVGWLYYGTVSSWMLYPGLTFAILAQSALLTHWWHYRRKVTAREAQGDFLWSMRQLKITTGLSFVVLAGVSYSAWVLAQSSLPSSPLVITIMLLLYLVGGTVSDFIHPPSVLAYPVVLLVPIGLLHAFSGVAAQQTIAGFFVMYFVSVLSYSSVYSKRLQLSIYQRFELDELAQNLDVQRLQAQQQTVIAQQQKALAQVAHEAKTRFFAATSHDVRQPLQAMSIMIDALRSEYTSSSSQLRLLNDMEVNMDALKALFDQVLEVSRLDAGTVQLHAQTVPLASLFERLQARFMMQAAAKRVTLRFYPASVVKVKADPLALERMVANLVGNALKHTPAGGVVWVAWRAQRKRLEVRDSGVGIARDQQQLIFDEFYQVGNTSRDHAQGLGLGLAIVRRLAQLGGQSVGVVSAPLQGSTFWLGLEPVQSGALTTGAPLSAPTSIPLASQRDLDPYSSAPLPLETSSSNADLSVASAAQAAFSSASTSTAAPTSVQLRGHVMFVENDESLLLVTTRLLRLSGWQVHPFLDPQQALSWLGVQEEDACHLVLTDFRMGEHWDGLMLIEAARSMPGRTHLPAIVITGDGAVAEQASFVQLNADQRKRTRLMHKPVKTTELQQAMLQLIEAQQTVAA